ncbi:MAG: type III PLP-dependent enzyme [Gammaproteobacteria bacterium]|nr:type III PLP-dependent enzyme [Gammaproteobacteria bacterium]NIM74591.1 type III PLP-dependent enzyme [Gammaproteobacteria bacterium]NIO26424.1 type III PLP-dependent enzyme [Gammaproteobacteria bacterium]NIO66976.1 type III PLP-dependent enzyme [Gammaproteobacteria bacterium]NIP46826.1 type III PLP-dependent enzyme [Gammaproteobacteria bacterium]
MACVQPLKQKTYHDARAVAEALTPSYPVYCLAPRVLEASARRFLEDFPGRVLYAVKCNPHPRVLQALYDAGIHHFDTASLPEIAQVREAFRNASAYFMHPVKSRAVIAMAYRAYGVKCFVVDHPAELAKVLDATGGEGVAIVVRLKTPEVEALYNLSAKFGAEPALAAELLRQVQDEGLRPGLSFHVGSQCLSPDAYAQALAITGEVIKKAGVEPHILDVGGGFPIAYPGQKAPPIEDYVQAIKKGIEGLGLRNDCVLMCEPGRAIVANGCSLLVQVLLRKEDEIYINDGIYGSLSEMVVARMRLPVRLIRLGGEPSAEMREFTVYGPTCDSVDVLPSTFRLPADVREDDWIEIGQIGAYSNAVATRFNGFFADTFVEVENGFPG